MRKKKPRMGRPPLPKGEGKGSVITIRLSDKERAVVADKAAQAGKKMSDWVRMQLLQDQSDRTIVAAETEGAGIEPNGVAAPPPGDVKPR